MSDRYLLDTDIVIEYLRGSDAAVEFIEDLTGEMLLSAITVAELWAGVKGEDERESLEQFALAFRIVPIDDEIARAGGLLRRDYRPSHGTGLADALIAATAEQEGATLVSFNAKHFPMLSDLEVPYEP